MQILPSSPLFLPSCHRPQASQPPTRPSPPLPCLVPGQLRQKPTLLSSSHPSSILFCSFPSSPFYPFLTPPHVLLPSFATESVSEIEMAIAHQRQSPVVNQPSPPSRNYSHHSPLLVDFSPALSSGNGHGCSFSGLKWQYQPMMMTEMTGEQSSIEVRRSPMTRREKMLRHPLFPFLPP